MKVVAILILFLSDIEIVSDTAIPLLNYFYSSEILQLIINRWLPSQKPQGVKQMRRELQRQKESQISLNRQKNALNQSLQVLLLRKA